MNGNMFLQRGFVLYACESGCRSDELSLEHCTGLEQPLAIMENVCLLTKKGLHKKAPVLC